MFLLFFASYNMPTRVLPSEVGTVNTLRDRGGVCVGQVDGRLRFPHPTVRAGIAINLPALDTLPSIEGPAAGYTGLLTIAPNNPSSRSTTVAQTQARPELLEQPLSGGCENLSCLHFRALPHAIR